MTKEEEFDYIQEVIDQEIEGYKFNLKELHKEKESIQIIENRKPITYGITFAEGNLNALKELKRVIEEKRYREVLHLDKHEVNE